MKTTTNLIREIEERFRHGDPASDLLPEFAIRITDLERQLDNCSGDTRQAILDEITRLLELLETAVAVGGDWLSRAGADSQELATEHLSQRIRQTYGLGRAKQHDRRTTT